MAVRQADQQHPEMPSPPPGLQSPRLLAHCRVMAARQAGQQNPEMPSPPEADHLLGRPALDADSVRETREQAFVQDSRPPARFRLSDAALQSQPGVRKADKGHPDRVEDAISHAPPNLRRRADSRYCFAFKVDGVGDYRRCDELPDGMGRAAAYCHLARPYGLHPLMAHRQRQHRPQQVARPPAPCHLSATAIEPKRSAREAEEWRPDRIEDVICGATPALREGGAHWALDSDRMRNARQQRDAGWSSSFMPEALCRELAGSIDSSPRLTEERSGLPRGLTRHSHALCWGRPLLNSVRYPAEGWRLRKQQRISSKRRRDRRRWLL
jgi:hypothetical protein